MNKEKAMKAVYVSSLVFSTIIGIWHFFVPYLFDWYSYIPNIPDLLRVSIDWINFFFSLLLVGISIILYIQRQKLFEGSKEVLVLYGFFVFVWTCRLGITFIHNWGYDMTLLMYSILFVVEFILALVPFIYLVKKRKDLLEKL